MVFNYAHKGKTEEIKALDITEIESYRDHKGFTGWLTPKGEFFSCEIGEHTFFAQEILKRVDDKSRDELEINKYIPIGAGDLREAPYVGILGGLTNEQVNWFTQYFAKLSYAQKRIVYSEMIKQGIKTNLTF